MRRLRQQSGTATLFLVAALLSYSGPAEGGQKTKKFLSDLNNVGNEWQTLEEFGETSNEEMRMVGSDVAQRNQYPYMVMSNIKLLNTSGKM
jgi:hypothetical protein